MDSVSFNPGKSVSVVGMEGGWERELCFIYHVVYGLPHGSPMFCTQGLSASARNMGMNNSWSNKSLHVFLLPGKWSRPNTV